MNVNDWLSRTTQELRAAGIGTARLDALVLLEDELNTNRTRILAYPDTPLTPKSIQTLGKQLKRRIGHEPLAYIRGKSEFYGREFVVSPAVLEPRPESETMIELLVKYRGLPAKPRIADVGTGSGALGITAILELKNAVVDLLDIDNKALAIAKTNVIKFATGQITMKSDLIAAAAQTYDVLLCNLPYVPDGFHINQAAAHEPAIAIFGGSDGLDLYRKLFKQAATLKTKPLLILTESLPPQHGLLAEIAGSHAYQQQAEDDFIQAFVPNV
jgi:release factor glutamine methyltransferase